MTKQSTSGSEVDPDNPFRRWDGNRGGSMSKVLTDEEYRAEVERLATVHYLRKRALAAAPRFGDDDLDVEALKADPNWQLAEQIEAEQPA
jgi:hypothetical protein